MSRLVIGKSRTPPLKIYYDPDNAIADYLPIQPDPEFPPPVIPIQGAGDMFRAVYDSNLNGVPDGADNVPMANIPGLQDTINDLYNQIGSGGGGGGSSSVINVTNTGGNTFQPGMPVCKVGAEYLPASSNEPRQNCLGLAVDVSAPGSQLRIQLEGLMSMSAVQWDLVTNMVGGLVPTAFYYIDENSRLTTTPPADFPQYMIKIGYALNTTDFLIDPNLSIKL